MATRVMSLAQQHCACYAPVAIGVRRQRACLPPTCYTPVATDELDAAFDLDDDEQPPKPFCSILSSPAAPGAYNSAGTSSAYQLPGRSYDSAEQRH